jgi:hypothetical protein
MPGRGRRGFVSNSGTYASYLVRMWREPGQHTAAADGWQGEVEHIQSGRQWRFDHLPELLTLLGEQTDDASEVMGMLDG